jgi:hypothetical protein
MKTCLVQSTCPQLRQLKADEHLTIQPRGEKEMMEKRGKCGQLSDDVQTELQRYWWRVLPRPEVGCSHTALWHLTFSTQRYLRHNN